MSKFCKHMDNCKQCQEHCGQLIFLAMMRANEAGAHALIRKWATEDQKAFI